VVEAYLARIERYDAALGAYLTVDAPGALQQAQAIDKKVREGNAVGALAGVPIGLKDLFVTRDLRTTCASKMLEEWKPPYDSTHAERIRHADGIILGKTNMDEFAMGASTENSGLKICRNPWDRTRVPGGSSGGSTAAVSARLCAAALGSDTGGSIRQPASFCGVTGIKPTYGRVSRYGMVAFASSLDQAGPIGIDARDCARLLGVVGGFDPRDATSLDTPLPDFEQACTRSIAGLRLGMPKEYWAHGADSEVRAAVEQAIAELSRAGIKTVEVSLPHTDYAIATYYLLCTAEASSNLARFDGVRFGLRCGENEGLRAMYQETRHAGFGEEVKRRILLGTFALSSGYYEAYYGKAQRVRTLLRRDFEKAFSQCDAIVAPVSPFVAFPLGERAQDPLQMYLADVFTCPVNLAGLPGMSVPCGFTAAGLPIGLQLIGAPLAEETLFALAGHYQRQTDWHRRVPAIKA
jgi:aspartyl-tRNA(Asn)/glutamyl-tRNA(Gln) amidotransferase subunit A